MCHNYMGMESNFIITILSYNWHIWLSRYKKGILPLAIEEGTTEESSSFEVHLFPIFYPKYMINSS
jgi:hypothetical protein